MSISTIYSTPLFAAPHNRTYASVAGSFYEFGTIGKSLYIRNAETNRIETYTAPTTFAHDRDLLINAGERVYRRNWRIVWFARLLAGKPTDTPPSAPAAMHPEAECEGFGNFHWSIPIAEQNSPAVAYRGTKRLCEHCCRAFDRSAEIVAKREAEARTVARVAACESETPKEKVIKVDATKPIKLTFRRKLILHHLNSGCKLVLSAGAYRLVRDGKTDWSMRAIPYREGVALRQAGWITDDEEGRFWLISDAGRAVIEGK